MSQGPPPQRAASSAVPRTSRRFRTPFAPPAPGAPRIWRCAELLPLWAESWRPRTRAEHCFTVEPFHQLIQMLSDLCTVLGVFFRSDSSNIKQL